MAKATVEEEGGNAFFNEDDGTVDLSGVDESVKFETMPRGKYPVILDSLEYKISESAGNPMWAWEMLITGDGEYAGRRLFYHTVFQGKPGALARTKRAIQIIAPQYAEVKFNAEEVADSGELVGAEFVAQVDIRTYNKERVNNVKDIHPASGGDDFL